MSILDKEVFDKLSTEELKELRNNLRWEIYHLEKRKDDENNISERLISEEHFCYELRKLNESLDLIKTLKDTYRQTYQNEFQISEFTMNPMRYLNQFEMQVLQDKVHLENDYKIVFNK